MNFIQKCKRNGGFTLVELIVVIAILAILAGVAVPAYTGYIKKAEEAADQQLLGAVNTAFAAACLEQGEDAKDVDLNVKTVALESVDGAYKLPANFLEKDSEYQAAFARYFAGNADSTFKTIKFMYYDVEKGVFTDNTDAIKNSVNRIDGSNYANNISALTGTVNNLAGMLGDRIGAEAGGVESLYKNHMSEDDYNSFMDRYNLTKDSSETEIANATVMFVADKLSGYTANDIANIMNGNAENIVKEFGNIPSAAMMYGLMAGYAHSEYNTSGFELNNNPTGITEVMGDFGRLQSDPNFQKYFSNADANKAGGTADLDGFLAAMDVVNGFDGSFDLTKEDLFVSEDVNNLMNSILGTN